MSLTLLYHTLNKKYAIYSLLELSSISELSKNETLANEYFKIKSSRQEALKEHQTNIKYCPLIYEVLYKNTVNFSLRLSTVIYIYAIHYFPLNPDYFSFHYCLTLAHIYT